MDFKTYFQSYEKYFWQWETDESVVDKHNLITIPNIGTISYRNYVMEILNVLQLQGLPPFGSLLLAMYITKPSHVNFGGLNSILKKIAVTHAIESATVISTISLLEKLYALDAVYKTDKNRVILLQTIFSECHNMVSAKNASIILKQYQKRPYKIATCAIKEPNSRNTFYRDLYTLALLDKKFSSTSDIIQAMKGFLDVEVNTEVIEDETSLDENKPLVEQLIENPNTFYIGSLIKRIWSGLRIPMHQFSVGEQPIGGIADMTNKGDYNRMILSEYAHDNDIFISRLANNEVLYIQREIPPEENLFERNILIDVSLKNWGTPKILAFATAISFIHHPKSTVMCKVFILSNNCVTPVRLLTVNDVIESQNYVCSKLDISHTLNDFLQHTEPDNKEILLITHPDNLENNTLQKVIFEHGNTLKYIITTTANGEINIFKHYNRLKKHLQKIVLPLNELWANPTKQTVATQTQTVSCDYPLLLPIDNRKITSFYYKNYYYILTNKKSLLETFIYGNYEDYGAYEKNKAWRGGKVLFEKISVNSKTQMALAKNSKNEFIICCFSPEKSIISKINLDTKEYFESYIKNYLKSDYSLLYLKNYFYLYTENESTTYRISVSDEVNIETLENDYGLHTHILSYHKELGKIQSNQVKVINNFTNIGINQQNQIEISGQALVLNEHLQFEIQKKGNLKIFAIQNKNTYTFPDGSQIITDAKGMLTFKSSNKSIPTFYIPSAHKMLAIATQHEWGGYEYYLPESYNLIIRKIEDMYSYYVIPFIDEIICYGTTN